MPKIQCFFGGSAIFFSHLADGVELKNHFANKIDLFFGRSSARFATFQALVELEAQSY
jgi:hypothetical protein